MENASRALIMAAGVLVGVLLLSLAVFLFTIFGNFGSEMTTQMNEKNLSEFNAQFTKYESYQDETDSVVCQWSKSLHLLSSEDVRSGN